MALSDAVNTEDMAGAGPGLRNSIKRNFEIMNERVPPFDPVADEGKVLKIVGGVPTWAADAIA